MLAINQRTRVFVHKTPINLRASYDGLCLRIKHVIKRDPFSGHLFVFFNARRTSLKAIHYDGTGLVLVAKRLDRGVFGMANPRVKGPVPLSMSEFCLLLEGADLRKRFIESPVSRRRMLNKILVRKVKGDRI